MWVGEHCVRISIVETTRAIRRIPGAKNIVERSMARTYAEHQRGEANFRAVHVPGLGKIATVVNKHGQAYVVSADVLTDYLIDRFAEA